MKVRLAYLYSGDDDEPTILLDEGQDFSKLYSEFNAQDEAMCNEEDPNGPAHKQWRGFTDFLEDKGVKIIDYISDGVFNERLDV